CEERQDVPALGSLAPRLPQAFVQWRQVFVLWRQVVCLLCGFLALTPLFQDRTGQSCRKNSLATRNDGPVPRGALPPHRSGSIHRTTQTGIWPRAAAVPILREYF